MPINYVNAPAAIGNGFGTALWTIILAIFFLILIMLVFALYLIEKHRIAVRRISEKSRSKLWDDVKHLEADLKDLERDLIGRK